MTAYPKAPKAPRSKGRARPGEPLAMWCEIGTWGRCTGRAEVRHHIRMRSQGGTDDPSNTLDICDAEHRYIHNHPAEAYERGWLTHGSTQ
jgi:hypothetical protein